MDRPFAESSRLSDVRPPVPVWISSPAVSPLRQGPSTAPDGQPWCVNENNNNNMNKKNYNNNYE